MNPIARLIPDWLEASARKLYKQADDIEQAYKSDGILQWTRRVADAYREAAEILLFNAKNIRDDIHNISLITTKEKL